jgi:hypothetical protein
MFDAGGREYLGGDEEWTKVDLGALQGGGHGGDGVSDGHELYRYLLEMAGQGLIKCILGEE